MIGFVLLGRFGIYLSVVFGLVAKRWPIDRRIEARRYRAGAAPQDGKG